MMVEIFGTDVSTCKEAEILVRLIKASYNFDEVSFDLEDREHILRIKAERIDADSVLTTLKELKIKCYKID